MEEKEAGREVRIARTVLILVGVEIERDIVVLQVAQGV